MQVKTVITTINSLHVSVFSEKRKETSKQMLLV